MKDITPGRPYIYNAVGMRVRCEHCGYVGEIEESDIGGCVVAQKGGGSFLFQCSTVNCHSVTTFKTPSSPCKPLTNT